MNFRLFSTHKGELHYSHPIVMAIMNATPDSFSDGGDLESENALHARIETIVNAGADCIDIGGESTRPGHEAVDEAEETKRVLRVLKAVREQSQIPVSIDTQKAAVADAALAAGADFINDVSALADPELARIVRDAGCSAVLMRNTALSEPVVASCTVACGEIIQKATQQGIREDRLILDPGLGFGDLSTEDFSALPGGEPVANLELIYGIHSYSHEFPVLIGASRKRFVGSLSGTSHVSERRTASTAIAAMAIASGASVLRVHDVKATVQVRNIMVSM